MSNSAFQYAENYCWSRDTYYVQPDIHVATLKEEERYTPERQLSYYKWVPFFLLLQAACFRLPSVLWNYLSFSSGERVLKLHICLKYVFKNLHYRFSEGYETLIFCLQCPLNWQSCGQASASLSNWENLILVTRTNCHFSRSSNPRNSGKSNGSIKFRGKYKESKYSNVDTAYAKCLEVSSEDNEVLLIFDFIYSNSG